MLTTKDNKNLNKYYFRKQIRLSFSQDDKELLKWLSTSSNDLIFSAKQIKHLLYKFYFAIEKQYSNQFPHLDDFLQSDYTLNINHGSVVHATPVKSSVKSAQQFLNQQIKKTEKPSSSVSSQIQNSQIQSSQVQSSQVQNSMPASSAEQSATRQPSATLDNFANMQKMLQALGDDETEPTPPNANDNNLCNEDDVQSKIKNHDDPLNELDEMN